MQLMAGSQPLKKPRDAALVLGIDQLTTDVARALTNSEAFSQVWTAGNGEAIRPSRHRKLDFFDRGGARRLAGILADVNPQTIVQLAVSRSPVTPARRGRFDATIAHALSSALRVWRERGGRPRSLVVLSSTAVYGLARTGPLLFDETSRPTGLDEADPSSPYGRWVQELRAAEHAYAELAEDSGLSLTVLRSAAVVGGPVASQVTDYLGSWFPVRVAGYDPPIQLVHYSDLVQSIVRVLEERAAGTINIVGRGVIPLSRLAARSGRFLWPMPPAAARWLAPEALGVGALCWRCVADGSRALQTLGMVPQFTAEQALGR